MLDSVPYGVASGVIIHTVFRTDMVISPNVRGSWTDYRVASRDPFEVIFEFEALLAQLEG